jgi:type II secretory pathway component PulF
MSEFQYKTISNGKLSTGVLAAKNINEAAALLRQRNALVLELEEAPDRPAGTGLKIPAALSAVASSPIWSRLMVSGKALEHSLRHLSVLIRGGVPILSALEICADQTKGRLKNALLEAAESIRAGHTLEESAAKHMPFLGRLTLGLIKVGESNGSLDAMFQYAADLMERKRKIRNNVIQALTYPAIVSAMSLAAGFYITTVAIPKITSLLGAKTRILPPITLALIDTSAFIRAHWAAILMTPVLIVVAVLLGRRNPDIGERVDWWILKTPLLGKAFRTSLNSLWCRNLGILLQSGIDIISAIGLTSEGLLNIHYKKEFERIRERVKSGVPFSECVRETTIKKLTPLAPSMIEIGENTGSVDEGLLYVADFNEKELERRLEFLSKIIEPILLVVVGGMVAFVYIAFFLGLMAVTRGAGL